MNFIEQQLQIASNFENIFISDNNSKLLEKELFQSKLQQLYENENNGIDLSKLGRKYKCCMYRLLPVAFKLYNQYSKYIPIQLSTTSNNLLDIYINKSNLSNYNLSNLSNTYNLSLVDTFENTDEYLHFKYNQRDISRIFEDLKTLGAMVEVSDVYTFGHSKYMNDCSKTYILSSKLLKSILLLSNINIESINNNNLSNYNYNLSNLSNTYNLSLVDTFERWNKRERDIYEKSLKIINESLQKQSMLPIECRYSLSKIGSKRPYSPFCSQWKSLEKWAIRNDMTVEQAKQLPENQGIIWREDYLDNYFGKNNWIEFDRNASIYNCTLLFNKKTYRPNNSSDMYELFNGGKFSSKAERANFKLCNMMFYFGDIRQLKSFFFKMAGTSDLWLKYENDMKLSVREMKTVSKFITDKDRFKTLLSLSGAYDKAKSWDDAFECVKQWYTEKRNNMYNTIGKQLKNSVFMVEAAINLQVADMIRNNGYRVLEVYDGFYTDCKDTNLLENIYATTAMKVVNEIR